VQPEPARGISANARPLRVGTAVAIATAVAASGVASASWGDGWRAERGGGVGIPPAPKISDVQCATKCAGLRSGIPGSKVAVSGKSLADVKKVQFASRKKWIAVKPDSAAGKTVKATVPDGAKTGKVRVVDAFANHAKSPAEFQIVDHLPPASTFKLRDASAKPGRAFFDGRRRPHLRYLFSARRATDLRINVVRQHMHGYVVRSYIRRDVEPNTENGITWDGRNEKGKAAPNGAYRFSVTPLGGGKTATDPDAGFHFFQYEFPVRGRHSYGDGLGAGRGHQGQDVMAKCGTKLVAASGGRVYWRKYQAGGAGNYVVINTYHGRSMMYAHLRRPALVRKGQRVHTGQKIGVVGDTGDATACHLHFELWSKPGWYQGGHVTNPTDDLKRWDGWS
jgi:murein DD-endopeptidase MepM/ murein hydrolase activator NlpD